ncbi:hypothetical protein GCM10010094_92670 [Streptomyces flaveus]|uniref:Uncharacterized protein n=1 Tax=Streptomyces flaveus TaxID=66370 RepID=A0A917VTL5_9ACTN|nr:hypothetical protein GCM10010094_92670 [Streptomyces flaveus]
MQPNEIIEVLNRPISQGLLARDVTRLACVAKDGPRAAYRSALSTYRVRRRVKVGRGVVGRVAVMCSGRSGLAGDSGYLVPDREADGHLGPVATSRLGVGSGESRWCWSGGVLCRCWSVGCWGGIGTVMR